MPNAASSTPATAGPAICEVWSTIWLSAAVLGTRANTTMLGITTFGNCDPTPQAKASSAASRYKTASGVWPDAVRTASNTQPAAEVDLLGSRHRVWGEQSPHTPHASALAPRA